MASLAATVEIMALTALRIMSRRLELECRGFCPHMPRLNIRVNGRSVDFVLRHVERLDCDCNFRGVSKANVMRKCEAAALEFEDLKRIYEGCNDLGIPTPIPPDFWEKWNAFVHELYLALEIEM